MNDRMGRLLRAIPRSRPRNSCSDSARARRRLLQADARRDGLIHERVERRRANGFQHLVALVWTGPMCRD